MAPRLCARSIIVRVGVEVKVGVRVGVEVKVGVRVKVGLRRAQALMSREDALCSNGEV